MPVRTILVEDSATIRETLIPTMEELADLVVIAVAETAAEAVTALRENSDWHLIVIDLFLKKGTGLEVLQACEGRQAGRRAVVLTNYATNDIRSRCKALGADAVFDKSTELELFFDYCAAFQ